MKIGSLFSGVSGPRKDKRGSQPKTYPVDVVIRVAQMYEYGATQAEIASAIGASQKVVWNLMRRHLIPTRKAAKRNQSGAMNHHWRGESAGYAAMHLRVAAERGTPSVCEHCGTTESKRYEWASKSKRYSDVHDYIRLCSSCHHKMDGHVKNLGRYATRKEVCP